MRVRPASLTFAALLGALAFTVLAPDAGAQTAPTAGTRGWVGMSVQFILTGPQRGTVLVTDVSEGSPAAKAGVEPGDLLMSINGHGSDDQFGGVMATLQAGDTVRVVLERDGQRRVIHLTAVARPAGVIDSPTLSVSVESDSMADVMFRAMDSLRVRLIQGSRGLVGVITLPGQGDVALPAEESPAGNIRLLTVGGDPAMVFGRHGRDTLVPDLVPQVRPPFSFFVFRGDRTDSLRSAMDELNQHIRELRVQQAQRLRQLGAETVEDRRQAEASDADLQRVAHALDDAGRRAADLRATMDRVAREEAQVRYQVGVSSEPGAPSSRVAFRPLAPYLLGQNRAAGAEVVNLRPELAEYFRVEGGVLVVDVPDGTPAALAGVQPGDVLTRVDGSPVRSIQELRVGLSRNGDAPLSLTLVRKGRTIQVMLKR